jgi:transcriptional regulator with XRE-family HTH domain
MDAIRNQGFQLNAVVLNRALAQRGLTARKLAEISGVPENTISQARRGHRRMSERTLRRLATALLACPLMDGAELVIGSDDAA